MSVCPCVWYLPLPLLVSPRWSTCPVLLPLTQGRGGPCASGQVCPSWGCSTAVPPASGVSGTPLASGPSCTIGACCGSPLGLTRSCRGPGCPGFLSCLCDACTDRHLAPALGHTFSCLTVRIPVFAVSSSPFESDLLTTNLTAPYTRWSDRGESSSGDLVGAG